jgi:hypothetical protein
VEPVAADGDLEMAHARERLAVQGHLVEAQHLPAALVSPHHAHHQHRALLDRPAPLHHLIEGLVKILQVGLGEEAEVAGVDREDRHAYRGCLAGGGEHGAVAAEHQGQGHFGVEAGGDAGGIALGAQVLVGVGEAHHPTGAADAHHAEACVRQATLDGVGGGEGQLLAIVDDQADPWHRCCQGGL